MSLSITEISTSDSKNQGILQAGTFYFRLKISMGHFSLFSICIYIVNLAKVFGLEW